jgi:hypothetical protein
VATLTRISPSSNASSSSPSLESLITIGLSIEGWLANAVSDARGNELVLCLDTESSVVDITLFRDDWIGLKVEIRVA